MSEQKKQEILYLIAEFIVDHSWKMPNLKSLDLCVRKQKIGKKLYEYFIDFFVRKKETMHHVLNLAWSCRHDQEIWKPLFFCDMMIDPITDKKAVELKDRVIKYLNEKKSKKKEKVPTTKKVKKEQLLSNCD